MMISSGKPKKNLEEKPAPILFHLPRNSYKVTRDLKQGQEMINQHRTALAMANQLCVY
jgi:hypothetical protein